MRRRDDEDHSGHAQNVTWKQRVRYRLDNTLAKGLGPVIGVLALVTLVVVVLAGFLLWLGRVNVNGTHAKGIEGVWVSLLRTLDPGTMGGDQGWRFRLTSLVVTVAGIFIVSTLIGLLANGISRRVDELRRGRSTVIESGHTLVLGWSPKVFVLVQELSAAAEASEHPCVVVLADRDMVEMEDALKQAFHQPLKIRIVTRTGDPSSPAALARVSPLRARSVVVLKDDDGSDATTVRTVLALEHLGLDHRVPVVIELDEGHHVTALAMASSLRVLPVVSREWIVMVTARAVQYPTLSDIYEDLLNFDGAEVHFVDLDERLHGETMCAAMDSVQGGAVFGVRREGELELAPTPEFVLERGDELIVIADERKDVTFTDVAMPMQTAAGTPAVNQSQGLRTHMLILGWSSLGERVLEILDQSLALGSTIDVVAFDDTDVEFPSHPFQRFELRCTTGETTDPALLARLLGDGTINRVLVLSGQATDARSNHDADALLTVLELRHLLADRPEVQVAVEITDPINVDLIGLDAREEFIVGERLVCLLMSQMSQTFGVMDVLRSLLAEDDVDLATIPATTIVEAGTVRKADELARMLRADGKYLIGAGLQGSLQLHGHLSTVTVTPEMTLVVVLRAGMPI